jgi:hypothetical protein
VNTTNTATTSTPTEAYKRAKDAAVAALLELMECADAVGRPPELMAAEIMGAFSAAAEKAQTI